MLSLSVKRYLGYPCQTLLRYSSTRKDTESIPTQDHRAGGALTHDWICQTLEGQPCYTLQEAGKTLKERFPARMKEARVELPSGSLAPGGYNFTLCVSKVRIANTLQIAYKLAICPTGNLPYWVTPLVD